VTAPPVVRLHAARGEDGSEAARVLARHEEVYARLRPDGRPGRPPVRLSGPAALLAEAGAGLPDGAAKAEAVAVRLARRGVRLEAGEPELLRTAGELAELAEARGASSVALVRADPSLLPSLELGGWYDTGLAGRLVRRAAIRAGTARAGATAVDAAFWRGVRRAATRAEWRRWTRSSYVVLVLHRVAGAAVPGQERLDLSPRRLRALRALLERLRYRPLGEDELLAFHAGGALPRRRYLLTVDDAFADAVAALLEAGAADAHVFVPTDAAGTAADWLDGVPVASWEELAAFERAGGRVGSHGRRHVRLPELGDEALAGDLEASLAELGRRLERPSRLLAYPHGGHDARVRTAAAAAGYAAAFSTDPGRNGAGADRHALRRVSVKEWDRTPELLWKLLTGEPLPPWWERLALRRARRRRRQ
jgi:peptidoglycan/xylan/chitin deacetylase (PgdA/CDA1 family)